MDGVDKSEVVHGCHFLLPRSGARLIGVLVLAPLVLNGDGLVPIHPLYVNKLILPLVDGGRHVQGKHIVGLANDPIPASPPHVYACMRRPSSCTRGT